MKTKPTVLPQMEAYKKAKEALVTLYQTDKGKKFVHHLIYSYSASKPRCILFSKSELKDCLSESPLLPLSTKDNPIDQKYIDLFMEMKNCTDETEKAKLSDKLNDELQEYIASNSIVRAPMRSDHTDRILGLDELQALYDFASEQASKGNTLIRGMIRVITKGGKKQINKPNAIEKSTYESRLNELVNRFNNR